MTRQLTASLESGDALLSISVPVREETGDGRAGQPLVQDRRADVHRRSD